eukprot:5028437-Pleurochrysis_carterae.AAC.1
MPAPEGRGVDGDGDGDTQSVLVVFAGSGEADSTLARSLRARGLGVVEIDVALGGSDHDVLRDDVAATLLEQIRQGRYAAVFAAPPCSSFS